MRALLVFALVLSACGRAPNPSKPQSAPLVPAASSTPTPEPIPSPTPYHLPVNGWCPLGGPCQYNG